MRSPVHRGALTIGAAVILGSAAFGDQPTCDALRTLTPGQYTGATPAEALRNAGLSQGLIDSLMQQTGAQVRMQRRVVLIDQDGQHHEVENTTSDDPADVANFTPGQTDIAALVRSIFPNAGAIQPLTWQQGVDAGLVDPDEAPDDEDMCGVTITEPRVSFSTEISATGPNGQALDTSAIALDDILNLVESNNADALVQKLMPSLRASLGDVCPALDDPDARVMVLTNPSQAMRVLERLQQNDVPGALTEAGDADAADALADQIDLHGDGDVNVHMLTVGPDGGVPMTLDEAIRSAQEPNIRIEGGDRATLLDLLRRAIQSRGAAPAGAPPSGPIAPGTPGASGTTDTGQPL